MLIRIVNKLLFLLSFPVRPVVGAPEPQAEDQVPGPDQGGEREVQGADLETRAGKREAEEDHQKVGDGYVRGQVNKQTKLIIII